MKISELNTKSFLGASGAAENSYVLINYEDETTNEPVTYKATVQELGKAIANKLQLTTNGQNGLATVKSSNGAWASEDKGQLVTAAEKTKIANAASTSDITAAISGLASTGYVTAAIANAGGAIDPSAPVELIDEHQLSGVQETYPLFIGGGSVRTFYEGSESGQATPIATIGGDRVVVYNSGTEAIGYYDPGDSYFNEITIGGAGVSAGYVANAIDGLASQGYVTSHAGPSLGNIAAAVNNSGTILNRYVKAIASTKAALAVNGAVNGLASTGYVTAAVANAGGGGFNPTTPVTCSVISENVTSQESLYPAMIIDDSGIKLWIQSHTNVGKFIYGGVLASVSDLDNMAYIGTSDNQPCIYSSSQEFIGFLSNDVSGMAYISTSDNRPCIRNKNYDFIGFLSTT